MNKEITFNTKDEEINFRKQLADKLISGEFEIVPSNNIESKRYDFLGNSIFRNTVTTEYFKLTTSEHTEARGSWTKVREVISNEPKVIKSDYRFASQLGGNLRLFGRIVVKLKILSQEGDLKVQISHVNPDENHYIKTSVDFGLMYGMDTIEPYKKLEGQYRIEVEVIGFHAIDSSSITIAYAANMALRRAFDKEKMHNSFLFESGRFSLLKKSPQIDAYLQ